MASAPQDPGADAARATPWTGDERELERLSRRLRRLARRLVDDETADDVVQEAWLAALEARPGEVRRLNHWLARVVRNLALRVRRRSTLRTDGEHDAARSSLDTDDLAERLSAYRRLASRLDELREPYRSVLRLRYFDDLSHAEIAARLGRPPETIKSQIKRGLRQLRDVLDRDCSGDRTRWLGALVGVAAGNERRPPDAPNRAARRGPSVPVGAALAGAIVVPVLAVVMLTTGRGSSSPADLAPDDRTPSSGRLVQPAAGDPRRAAVDVAPRSSEPAPAAATVARKAPARLELTIVRADGRPASVARLWVQGVDDRTLFRAEVQGGYATLDVEPSDFRANPLDPTGVLVSANGPNDAWSDLHQIALTPGATARHVVRLGGAPQSLSGFVVDELGKPRAGVRVRLQPRPFHSVERDGIVIAKRTQVIATDEHGAFLHEHIGPGSYELRLDADDSVPHAELVTLGGSDTHAPDRRWVLPRGARLVGRVLSGGRPVAGSRVWIALPASAAPQATQSDDGGHYRFDGVPPGAYYVNATDSQDPTHGACRRFEVAAGDEAVVDLDLAVLPALRPRVVGPEGRPPAFARIVLLATVGGQVWMHVEALDSDGRAVVTHLPDETLTLLVMTPEASRYEDIAAEVVDVRPGPDELVVRLEPLPQPGRVHGVALGADGAPLEHAYVELMRVGRTGMRELPIDPASGRFDAANVLPGTFRATVRSGAGEAWDLGLVEIESGATRELGVRRAPAR